MNWVKKVTLKPMKTSVNAILPRVSLYIRPNIFLIILVSVNMVLMCILGGKGTIAGPVIGAVLIVAFNEIFVATLGSSEFNILATGLIMALALMFFPLGIVGTLAAKHRLPRFLNWD